MGERLIGCPQAQKENGFMSKKIIAMLALAFFVFAASGCGTAKGACKGFQEDWQTLKKADDWMRKHLW